MPCHLVKSPYKTTKRKKFRFSSFSKQFSVIVDIDFSIKTIFIFILLQLIALKCPYKISKTLQETSLKWNFTNSYDLLRKEKPTKKKTSTKKIFLSIFPFVGKIKFISNS